MSAKAENERLRKENEQLHQQLAEAQKFAESQRRNIATLAGRVSAHRTIVVDHIRECQMFPEDERLQILTVALITELDMADLNVSAEVRVVPKASRP